MLKIHSAKEIISLLTKYFDPNIESKLLLLVLGGSRLYGSYTDESDWDYCAVTTEKVFNVINPEKNEENNNEMNSYPFPPSHDITVFETEDKLINITFYDLTYFNILLFQQHVAILEVIFAPQNYILLDKLNLKDTWKIDSEVCKKCAIWEANQKFGIASKRFQEGKIYKGQKMILLSIRMLMYSHQLILEGRISNYSVANGVWQDIKNTDTSDWKQIIEKFRPIYRDTEKTLRLTTKFGFFTREEVYSKIVTHFGSKWNVVNDKSEINSSSDKAAIIQYIKENGVKSLVKFKNLDYCVSKDNCNLISLSVGYWGDIFDQNMENCIIDLKSMKIIAGLQKSIIGNDQMEDTDFYDVKSKSDGIVTILYYHDKKWQIGSTHTPDGEEKIAFKVEDGTKPENISLKDKFWQIWNENNYKLPEPSDIAYVFSLQIPNHRYLVEIVKPELIFLDTWPPIKEVETLSQCGWKTQAIIASKMNKSNIFKLLENLNPFKSIGFTAKDNKGNIFDFLSPQYISASISLGFLNKHSAFNLSADYFEEDCLLDVLRFNKKNLFLMYFPKWKSILDKLIIEYEKILQYLNDCLRRIESSDESTRIQVIKQEDSWIHSVLFYWDKHERLKNASHLLCSISNQHWKTIKENICPNIKKIN